jgi:hypothetical protein
MIFWVKNGQIVEGWPGRRSKKELDKKIEKFLRSSSCAWPATRNTQPTIETNAQVLINGFFDAKRLLHSIENLIDRVKVAFKDRIAVRRENNQQRDRQTADRF